MGDYHQERQINLVAQSMGQFAKMARELQWKLTEEAAAKSLGIDVATLQAVEAGDQSVTLGTMLRVWKKMQILGDVQTAALNADVLIEAEISRDMAIHSARAAENLRKLNERERLAYNERNAQK